MNTWSILTTYMYKNTLRREKQKPTQHSYKTHIDHTTDIPYTSSFTTEQTYHITPPLSLTSSLLVMSARTPPNVTAGVMLAKKMKIMEAMTCMEKASLISLQYLG